MDGAAAAGTDSGRSGNPPASELATKPFATSCTETPRAIPGIPAEESTETNSILQDPLYVNRLLGDFHLQAGSPGIDSANSAYASGEDYAGTPRPHGAGPDLGAYER